MGCYVAGLWKWWLLSWPILQSNRNNEVEFWNSQFRLLLDWKLTVFSNYIAPFAVRWLRGNPLAHLSFAAHVPFHTAGTRSEASLRGFAVGSSVLDVTRCGTITYRFGRYLKSLNELFSCKCGLDACIGQSVDKGWPCYVTFSIFDFSRNECAYCWPLKLLQAYSLTFYLWFEDWLLCTK